MDFIKKNMKLLPTHLDAKKTLFKELLK